MTSLTSELALASTAVPSTEPKAAAGQPSGVSLGADEAVFGQLMAEALGALSEGVEAAGGPAGDAAGAAALVASDQALAPTTAALSGNLQHTAQAVSDAPNEQSLLAFARGQGLDEQALSWLFPGATAAQVAAQAGSQGLASTAGLSALPLIGPLAQGPTSPLPAADGGEFAESPQAFSALAQIGALFGSPWLAPSAGVGAGASPDTTASAPVVSLPAAMPAPKLLLVAAAPAKDAPVPELALAAAGAAATEATEEIDLRLAVEEALEPESPSLQRILGLLREINAKQADGKLGKAAALPGPVSGAAAVPALGAAPSATGTSAPLSSANVLSSADAGALWRANTGVQAATLAVANPSADQQGRLDAFDALGQRLGEAMGERIKSQFERGNWQVKFNLSPQALGQVEVELRMRAGEMEAALRAPQALTRELLAEGLPRLREVLSQSGIDVASFHIGQGQSQHSGGRSTPRQGPGAGGSTGAEPAVSNAPAPAPVRSRHDGFDVVV